MRSLTTFILLGIATFAMPQLKAQKAPIGSAAWYQAGRTAVNLTTGQGYAYGYYTQIAGVNGPMFNGTGTPSEVTAFFTFKTSIFQVIPMKPNGDLSMAIVMPDTFNVYYDPNPNRDWTKPDSFTTGTVVATFTRDQFLLLRVLESWGTEYVHLDSSQDFNFNGETLNFGKVLAAASLSSTYSNAPIPALPNGFNFVTVFAGNAIVATGPKGSSSNSPRSADKNDPQRE